MRSWQALGVSGIARRAAVPARWAVAILILALVVHETGSAPFTRGLRSVTIPLVVAGIALTAVTTECVALRWCLVSRALGEGLSLSTAVGAYYRSQLLNILLPTGVLGDAHRAVVHGRRVGGLGRGARTVVWDRLSGQVLQIVVTAVLLLVLPSPVHDVMPAVVVGLLAVIAVAVAAARWAARHTDRRFVRTPARALTRDLERLTARDIWPTVTLTSLLAVAGHAAVFLLAVRAVGVTIGSGTQLALALLVLASMALPLSIAGWGPREGVAFWAFAAMGLGGSAGVAVTTVYAVLGLCGVLPGAVLLLVDAIRSRHRAEDQSVSTPTMTARSQTSLEADRG